MVIPEELRQKLARVFLDNAKPMMLNLHFKYLPVSFFRAVWLFLTFQNPPLNPKWVDLEKKIENGDDTVTFRRPTDYLK